MFTPVMELLVNNQLLEFIKRTAEELKLGAKAIDCNVPVFTPLIWNMVIPPIVIRGVPPNPGCVVPSIFILEVKVKSLTEIQREILDIA